ncbi:FGFR1 oncogene partner [Elysia marginata]|uniref:FGFR1 oncogene partner n=1 Tax=Elysia marginata TaxID=1093978 RepID=A0AAV4HI57_9GAST|nr:FGFR1 oncogene partner [Elysia marginata]
MSADEDTELRDLVAQTLESNGTLGKLRAQLRASVFLALEDQENGQDLTKKQIEEAQAKFDYYDKDNSGAIDKDELRDLFIDMFPSFHRNMLERYVNDEFNAVDKDFSSSIDFDEFLGMYKRLFLCCRSVVATDVEDIVSPSHKSHSKNARDDQQRSDDLSRDKPDMHKNATVGKMNNIPAEHDDGSDIEEDPFFDDAPAAAVNFNTLSSELEKNKDGPQGKLKENGEQGKGSKQGAGSGLSSLDGLPSLTAGRGSDLGSLAGAPPLGGIKSPGKETSMNDSDLDKNLRAIDKRMVDLGLDSQNDDYEYEDDFSPEHSLSQKSPRNSKADNKPENGSIAEEIDDEEIDEISIEADDLLRSEKSGFDELTTDHSISQADGGFDYMEDPVLP